MPLDSWLVCLINACLSFIWEDNGQESDLTAAFEKYSFSQSWVPESGRESILLSRMLMFKNGI